MQEEYSRVDLSLKCVNGAKDEVAGKRHRYVICHLCDRGCIGCYLCNATVFAALTRGPSDLRIVIGVSCHSALWCGLACMPSTSHPSASRCGLPVPSEAAVGVCAVSDPIGKVPLMSSEEADLLLAQYKPVYSTAQSEYGTIDQA